MPERDTRDRDDDLMKVLEETGRTHAELREKSRKRREEIRAETRKLREAIARFDARNASS